MEHLEDILDECAGLQCVCGGLGHRIIRRFEVFVNAAMFGGSTPEEKEIHEKYRDKVENRFKGGPEEFMMWAKLFLEYCKEEFRDEEE